MSGWWMLLVAAGSSRKQVDVNNVSTILSFSVFTDADERFVMYLLYGRILLLPETAFVDEHTQCNEKTKHSKSSNHTKSNPKPVKAA